MPPRSASAKPAIPSRRHAGLKIAIIAAVGVVSAALAFTYLDQLVVEAPRAWTDSPVASAAIAFGMWLGGWRLGPIVVVLMLLAARPDWRRLLKTLVVAYLFQVATVKWLKLLMGRPRPRLVPDASVFGGFAHGRAFPSGHASFAFMLAIIVSAWFPRWRLPAWLLAVWVAVSRVLVNAHFASDVIAGATIGAVAGAVVLWIWPPVTEETREAIEEEDSLRRQARLSPTPEQQAAERRMALRVLTAVLFIGGALLAYWYVDPIRAVFDNALFQTRWMQSVWKFGRLIGTWDLAPLLVAIALIVGRDYWRRLLASLLTGFAIQTAATETLKWIIGRPRPSQIADPDLFFGPASKYHSLPSGHASFIFVFAVICGAWFPRARVWLYALAAFVAFSRVGLGAHYVSDVTAGALIGIISGWIVLAVWPPRGDRMDEGRT